MLLRKSLFHDEIDHAVQTVKHLLIFKDFLRDDTQGSTNFFLASFSNFYRVLSPMR